MCTIVVFNVMYLNSHTRTDRQSIDLVRVMKALGEGKGRVLLVALEKDTLIRLV